MTEPDALAKLGRGILGVLRDPASWKPGPTRALIATSGAVMPPEPELTGLRLPEGYGQPVIVTGWTPEAGQVTYQVPADHPAYAALTEGGTRGLSLPEPDWRPLLRPAPGWPCIACGSVTAGAHEPGCPGGKINLPGNPQVAPEPAGNLRRPSPPEESPVDELPLLTATVTLSLTVPAERVPAAVARLSSTLTAAVQDSGEQGWVGAASLSVYPVTPDADEEEE